MVCPLVMTDIINGRLEHSPLLIRERRREGTEEEGRGCPFVRKGPRILRTGRCGPRRQALHSYAP